ncbi:MAG TPA: hypothetical protein VK862_07550 [Afifellaceae bacterium]|nr:hypothetical protein [Afifellaceae bacterium]
MAGRFIAMLALEQPSVVGLDDLVAALKSRVPELENDIVGRPYRGDKVSASEAYIVSISGNHFAVAFVDHPAPYGTFDAALHHSFGNWPDGGVAVERHQAHVMLSNLVLTKGFNQAVDVAGSVTLIAGLLNSLAASVGVYWANGEVLLPQAAFEAATAMLIAGDPPVNAWVNIRSHPGAGDGGEVACLSTLGLDSFCGREIETPTSPDDVASGHERVLAVAADVLRNGPGLADNSELRIGENASVTVNLVDHGEYDPDQAVIRLTPVAPETGRPVAGSAPSDGGEAPRFARRKRNKQFAT